MTTTQAPLEAAYETAHMDVAGLLDQLTEKLGDMPAPDSGATIHWGHVGDLQQIKRQLEAILEGLA